ncbi:hypothetical protein [Actinomadura rupiterrae]|uniref:hypothetical protein n=1 Tax=Actinomadura rupiterrae TaxID=559627 RepID=UPI0020A2ECE1|nr:hypothetical protein [Actinomadura rupiterrae]MCP2341777.1 hypothetical protein [Actinomadura rupiterrae]
MNDRPDTGEARPPVTRLEARRTGDATGGPGSNVNTGIQQFITVQNSDAPRPARSAYRYQVEQIFPWELVGREAELAELAGFCAGDAAYAWWQAPAWAGKSALMAWFVLHPPPGVRIASFFITARYAGQSDRTAFLDVMLEQLAEIAEQSAPPPLTESTRPSWFGRLLDAAATACRERGERLVLVVDGLDEDQGVTAGPSAHSIAALLPARPPEGVHVIAAGRPDPPVPADVPARHPLRDPAIVRRLEPSAEARVIRDDAERELAHLLFGDGIERDVLGLSAAAGGGLSAADLAELTGEPPGRIERHLRAAPGRTFTSRAAQWRPGTKVYVLGHEELHNAAVTELQGATLDAYRDRIHAWADRYCDRPSDAPEYLVLGYFRMLVQAGDLPRMVALATDPRRQDMLLDVTGGDTVGLAETTACQDAIGAVSEPSLRDLLVLARMRERLFQRNSAIPAKLPAAWARIGDLVRAEALTQSLTEPLRSEALGLLSEALADLGELAEAERFAHAISDPDPKLKALLKVVEGLVIHREPERARRLADRVRTAHWSPRDGARRENALLLAAAGDLREAAAIAEGAEQQGDRESLLVEIVTRFAVLNVAEASAVLDLISHADRWARCVLALAEVVARIDKDHALALLDSARRALRPRREHFTDPNIVGAECRVLARAGQPAEAIELARSVFVSNFAVYRESVLVDIIRILAEGDLGKARDLAALYSRAYGSRDPDLPLYSDNPFADLRVLLAARDVEGAAESLAARLHLADLELAEGYAAHGWTGEAAELARRAEREARDKAVLGPPDGTLVELVSALGEIPAPDRARRLAATIKGPGARRDALIRLARYALAAGEIDRAQDIAALVPDPRRAAELRHEIITTVAARGDLDRARTLIAAIDTVRYRDMAYADIARIADVAGASGEADADAARIDDPQVRSLVQNELLQGAVTRQDFDRAEAIARSAREPHVRTGLLLAVVRALAEAGRRDRALALAGELQEAAEHLDDPLDRDWATLDAVIAIVTSGDTGRALRAAESIGDAVVRVGALAEIAKAPAAGPPLVARLLAQAAELAGSLPGRADREAALQSVIRAHAATGGFAEARAMAAAFGPQLKSDILHELAKAAAAAGQYDWAHSTAGAVASLKHEWALYDIAAAAIRAEDVPRAETHIRAIANLRMRDRAIRLLAETTATTLNPSDEDPGVAEVKAALRAGDLPRAEELAAALEPPARRIARARIAEAADPERSRAILADLLRNAPYVLSLKALAKTDPQALLDAIDDLP